jgi:hypothetical protein
MAGKGVVVVVVPGGGFACGGQCSNASLPCLLCAWSFTSAAPSVPASTAPILSNLKRRMGFSIHSGVSIEEYQLIDMIFAITNTLR